MHIRIKKIIVSMMGYFLLVGIFFYVAPPGPAEAAPISRISAAKGLGLMSLVQRWDNKYVKKVVGQKYENAKEVVGYYTKDYASDNQSQDSLHSKAENITGVATFSYGVKPSGQISGSPPKAALKTAWDNNIETLALVHNLSSSGFNRSLIHSILVNPELRTETITNIYKTLIRNSFDGVNIDFENVPAGDRQALNKFMAELKQKLAPDGLKVTISVPAKTWDNPLDGWGAAFDYKRLADSADRIMLMTYDEHYIGGHPGPVASNPWVEQVVSYSAELIPKDKLMLGIGNYGYDWIINSRGYQSVPAKNALPMAQRYGASIHWDSLNQTPFFYYWKNNQKHVVWFESPESAAFKLDLVNKYDLKGIAIWRLGFESPGFWNLVSDKLNK